MGPFRSRDNGTTAEKENPMEWLPIALFAVACPVGMGLMMWFMMRGQHQGQMADHKGAISPEERLTQLDAEKRALEQQLASDLREAGKVTGG